MSLSFLLKSGQRTILSILPKIRTLGREELGPGKNFHSLCKNDWQLAPRLLETTQSSSSSSINAARGMKTKGKLNLRCKDCYFVTRQGRRYVMCKSFGRHKQQAMVKKVENTWILTHATQSKRRPW